MPRYVALLRAVNVGGTGKLPMTELKAMCVDEGFGDVQTYIASGNVVFSSSSARRRSRRRWRRGSRPMPASRSASRSAARTRSPGC